MKQFLVVLAVLALFAGTSNAQFVPPGSATGSVTVNVACLAEVTVSGTSATPIWVAVGQSKDISVTFKVTAAGQASIGWSRTFPPGNAKVSISAPTETDVSPSTVPGDLGDCDPYVNYFDFTLGATATGVAPGQYVAPFTVTLTSYTM